MARRQTSLDRPQQVMVVVGLFEQGDRSAFHQGNSHRHVGNAGNHDHRERTVGVEQSLLQFDPVDLRHLHVGDYAAGSIEGRFGEKHGGGRKAAAV